MTMTHREILEAVAAGRMTPDQAAELFETPNTAQSSDGDEGRDAEPSHPQAGAGPTSGFRVRISATARSVRVVGDPSVTEATVEGSHRAHRDGDTLFIDGNVEVDDVGGFAFEGRRPPWHRQWANWRRFAEQLVVRVNPTSPIDAEVSAGSLVVVGVTGPLRVVVAAGSARLDGISSPFDIETRAGAVRVRGRLDAGESRIRCEAGSVNVHLTRGSDVRVRARTDLGRVRVHGLPGHEPQLGGQRELTIGAGTASLDIETAMGSVDIHTEEPVATAGSRW
ncbi:MAG TPA: hypothetical protein VLL25_03035 [Acidimicrobiales bacterium]|nr:hypothetical protein [Acidimicrobiales bacterium]